MCVPLAVDAFNARCKLLFLRDNDNRLAGRAPLFLEHHPESRLSTPRAGEIAFGFQTGVHDRLPKLRTSAACLAVGAAKARYRFNPTHETVALPSPTNTPVPQARLFGIVVPDGRGRAALVKTVPLNPG